MPPPQSHLGSLLSHLNMVACHLTHSGSWFGFLSTPYGPNYCGLRMPPESPVSGSILTERVPQSILPYFIWDVHHGKEWQHAQWPLLPQPSQVPASSS